MMRIYLAARYSRREELCQYKAQLERLGHIVTSRWLDGHHQYPARIPDGVKTEMRAVWAREDLDDLLSAEACVSFTEPPRVPNDSRGGRHVEHGAALVSGKRCVVVGPLENVFHCLAGVEQYDTWEVALLRLEFPGQDQAPFAEAMALCDRLGEVTPSMREEWMAEGDTK